MKSLITTISATNMRRLRLGLAVLAMVLVAVAVGIGLARELYLNLQPQSTAPAPNVGIPAPLDQHERHPNGLPADMYAPLDQHERPARPVPVPPRHARPRALKLTHFHWVKPTIVCPQDFVSERRNPTRFTVVLYYPHHLLQ